MRKNLGAHALDIAQTCTKLPYFNHSLELLLHRVLEEEGTSSEPTPDPLLPSVVAFVQEFPVYLQTIAHCARKSDIALWPRLFAEAGEPMDLFRECLDSGQLDIAASFLIVLNSTLSVLLVRKQAGQLLEKAKAAGDVNLSAEVSRFLRALESDEMDSLRKTPDHHANHRKSPTGIQHSVSVNDGGEYTSPISPQGTSTFKYGPPTRNRTISESMQNQLVLKRVSSAPFSKEEILTSVTGLVAHDNTANGNCFSAPERLDSVNSVGSSSNLPVSSSTPSLSSKQMWSRKRFPGHAQVLEVEP